LKKSKFSLTNALDKYGARACTACQRKYAFQSGSGTFCISLLRALKNFGSVTLKVLTVASPLFVRYDFQSKEGVSFSSSAADILIRSESEHPSAARVLHVLIGKQRRETLLALQRGNLAQHRLQRPGAESLDLRVVHAGLEVVANPLLRRRSIRARLRCILEDAPEELSVLFAQLSVDAPRRLIGRNRIVLHPSAADVLIEVVARICSQVHRRHVE